MPKSTPGLEPVSTGSERLNESGGQKGLWGLPSWGFVGQLVKGVRREEDRLSERVGAIKRKQAGFEGAQTGNSEFIPVSSVVKAINAFS